MSVIDTLITDRTDADITAFLAVRERIKNRTATAADWTAYLADSKAAYNASDLNRVGNALNYVCGRLNANGFDLSVSAKTDWEETDIPTVAQMLTYKEHIESVRSAVSYPAGAPTVPDMNGLNYAGANNIENILLLADSLIDKLIQTFIHSGTTFSGIVGGLIL